MLFTDDPLVTGQRGRVPPGPDEPPVLLHEVVRVAGQPDPAADDHHEVVADLLEVGDEVRGEDDAQPVLGHG